MIQSCTRAEQRDYLCNYFNYTQDVCFSHFFLHFISFYFSYPLNETYFLANVGHSYGNERFHYSR